MDITIIINGNELITLHMLIMDRIKDCDKNWKTSLFYDDKEGIDYWAREKTLATRLLSKLDGVF